MEKRVLFICKEPGFLAKAMIKSLEEHHYEVDISHPDSAILSSREGDFPPVFLLYMEDNIQGFEECLKYLQDTIAKNHGAHRLYIIGSKGELDFVHDIIPPEYVDKMFTRPVDPKDVILELDKSLSGSSDGMGRKILIVDDDPILLRTMKAWLDQKYTVYMSNSGKDAIEFLKVNDVDLVLLDYEMPETSGLETFEIMKRDAELYRIPVIFLTAKDDRETVEKVLDAHPEKYILKTLPQIKITKSIDAFFAGE